MDGSASSAKRKFPDVRVACFCDTVLQGKDDVITLVRIIDRAEIDLAEALPPELPEGTMFPYKVTFFVMLDKVSEWRGDTVELWARAPQEKLSQVGGIALDEATKPVETVNLIFNTSLNILKPGVYEFELRLASRKLLRRTMSLIVRSPESE